MSTVELAQACRACRAELGTDPRYCRTCGLRQGGEPADPRTDSPDRSAVLLPTRPPVISLLVISGVVAALLALTLPVLVIRSALFGPGDTVTRYFAALSDRDADRAWAQLSNDGRHRSGNPLLTSAALRDPGYRPPANASVTNLDVDGKRATASVRYDIGGKRLTSQLELEQRDGRSHPLNRWRITNGLVPLRIPFMPGGGLLVAGRAVPEGEESGDALAVFPGAYGVTMAEDAFLEIRSTSVVAGDDADVDLEPAVKESARRDIAASVRAWLDGCAKSTSVEPPGCPFSYSDGFYTLTDVGWKIAGDPALDIEPDDSGGIAVSGDGRVQITARTDSPYQPTLKETVRFSFTGVAVVSNGQVQFQYHG